MLRPTRHYAVTLSDDPTRGLHAVSLVERPAIERQWVTLAAEQPDAQPVRLAQEAQKQRLTGPVLIPGQVILRLDPKTGEPFTISFDAATIEAANLRMKAQGLTTQTTHQHEVKLEGNVIEETWIIKDPANDKAVALGFADLPAGTLMMSVRITDSTYWQTEVLTGNVRGFSIEGLFDFAAALAAIPPPMTEPEKPNAFMALLAKMALKMGLTPADIDGAPAAPPAKEPEPAPEPEPEAVTELKAQLSALATECDTLKLAAAEVATLKAQNAALTTQLAAVTADRDAQTALVVELKATTPAAPPVKLGAQESGAENKPAHQVYLEQQRAMRGNPTA